jgi:hypothetical protein
MNRKLLAHTVQEAVILQGLSYCVIIWQKGKKGRKGEEGPEIS